MRNRLVRLFCEMVQIGSESGNESEFIGYLKKLFEREVGASCMLDSCGNLLARVAGKTSRNSDPVLLVAHADTVKPGVGIEPVLENGIIRSEGETILGADNKAAIAEIAEAVRRVERRPPVEIVITRGEETGLIGAKNLDLSLVNARMGFVFDTSDLNAVVIGGPTYIALDIDVIGNAAHAGLRPEEGISAVRVAALAIASIPEGRIDEETTSNVGVFHGGTIRNGVPARVTIQAECRSLNHKKCIRQAEVMRKAFEKTAKEAGARVMVNERVDFEASCLSDDSPVVEIAKAAISAAGLQAEAKVTAGGSDALVLTRRGIDTVVLGYGGKKAHSTDEYITVSDMEMATKIIGFLLQKLA